jgi:L,D-transpeptidase catalytic domain
MLRRTFSAWAGWLLLLLTLGALAAAPAMPAPVPAELAQPAALAPSIGPAVWLGATTGRLQGLSPQILRMALDAMACARSRGAAGRDDRLTIIDYTLPSTAPRLWVLDLANGKVLYHELVAHGVGSGDTRATRFSNEPDSRQSSLGLFLTGATYEGGNGYSLKLQGLDPGVNDLAEERHIVIHGAWYVSAEHARQYGRLGRSWGCPALPLASAHGVIDAIKGGSYVFAYAAGEPAGNSAGNSLRRAAVVSGCAAVASAAAAPAGTNR